MQTIRDLPDDLARRLSGRDLILFDGECVLCSGFFRFMLARDTSARFSFVTAQSDLGGALYRALGLSTEAYETNIVITDGRIWRKLDAFAAAMSALGWPWRVLAGVSYLPVALKTPLYDCFARNRYRIFGRYDQCTVPTPDIRARFLDS